MSALTGVRYLPEPVIFSGDAQFSTLLDKSRSALTQGKETLPGVGATDYVSFMFRATGGTNLLPVTGPDSRWFLTFFTENTPLNATSGIPDNYVTAQIEPVTGRIRIHRP
jgi:uncharacterized protein (TIGR02596 family)